MAATNLVSFCKRLDFFHRDFQYSTLVVGLLCKYLQLKVGETTHYGGGTLEYMTLSKKVGEKGGDYYFSPPGSSKYGDTAYGNQFDVSEVSKEALASDDAGKGIRFWELSEKLVGI